MSWRFGRSMAFIVAAIATISSANAQESKAELIAKCALALAPEITLINASDSLKTSWLVLITKETYESAKQQIKTSGNVDLLGLIGVGGDASWDQFQESRTKYLEHRSGTWDEQHALSIFRQALPVGAGQNFVDCVKVALTKTDGVVAWFSQESAESATLHVRYRGTPNTQARLRLQVFGAKGLPQTLDLPHDAESQFIIKRPATGTEIKVAVNSEAIRVGDRDWRTSRGLADTALSIRSLRATPGPAPRLIVREVLSEANMGSPDSTCTYMVDKRNVEVVGYDLTKGTNFALDVKGEGVVPAPGVYDMLTETHGPQVATRTLNDLLLSGGATIAVRGGGASALLVVAPRGTKSCPHPKVRFVGVNVSIEQPPPIFGESPIVSSEQLDLTQDGNFRFAGGSVNCPQCGNLYYADLTTRLNEPVWKIVSVTSISKDGNWHRCSVEVGLRCETANEFTATADKRSGTCVGASTCYLWRWQRPEDQGGPGRDTIKLEYHARRCERYCPW